MIEIDNINGITVNGAFHILVSCEAEECACEKCSINTLCFSSPTQSAVCKIFGDGANRFERAGKMIPMRMPKQTISCN